MSVESIITENLDIWTSAIKTKSASGRGSSNKLELYGIKKLRELILTLGVQGKLTCRSEIEDSAAELLNEITSIREALVESEGLKTKASNKINDSEIYFDAPESWSVCRLGNLAKFIDYRGKTPNKIEKGVRLITAKNVRFGYLSLEPAEYISEDEYAAWMSRGFPKKGDLLFTPEAPLGNVAVIDLTEKFALAQRAICFQFHKTDITPFLKYFIMSSAFQSKLIAESSGMTATGIKASKLKEIIVPLPSLSEQKKIVSKIEKLMSLCDQLESQTEASIEAHQTLVKSLLKTLTNAKGADELNESWQRISEHFDVLFTTEDSIDQLKQTILQLAVMGKLVKQDPNDEPASKLLERIAAEKEQLIKDKKIKKQKALPGISEDEKPFEIPCSWGWIRLGELAVLKGGNAFKSQLFVENSEFQLVRMGNVRPDQLRLNEKEIFLSAAEAKLGLEYEIGCNEILITMTGTKNKKDYLYSALVTIEDLSGKKLFLNQRLCKVTVLAASPAFINLSLKEPRILDLVFAQSTGTANQANSSMVAIGNWLIPVPPLEEQNRIIEKLQVMLRTCDALKQSIKVEGGLQSKLADSIQLLN